MMALVSSEEVANDVTGAEALLERHQVSAFIASIIFGPNVPSSPPPTTVLNFLH